MPAFSARKKASPNPAPHRPHANGRAVTVRDRDALAQLIERALSVRFRGRGGLARAARLGGLAASQLTKLRQRALGSISAKTFDGIERILATGEDQASLREVTLLPADADLLERATAAYYAEMRRILPLSPDDRRMLIRYVREAFPATCRPFEAFARRRGHITPRIELAYVRAVAPLLQVDGRTFGEIGIELTLAELGSRRWGKAGSVAERFVELGLMRERLLLDREPDHLRAYRRADGGTVLVPRRVGRSSR